MLVLAATGFEVAVASEVIVSFPHDMAMQSQLQRLVHNMLHGDNINKVLTIGTHPIKLRLTVHVLNNATESVSMDVAWLAAIAALYDTKLPIDLVEQEGRYWISNDQTRPLLEEQKRSKTTTAALTMAVYDNQLIVDPTNDELKSCSSQLIIVVDTDADIRLLQSLGPISRQLLVLAVRLAHGRTMEISKLLLDS